MIQNEKRKRDIIACLISQDKKHHFQIIYLIKLKRQNKEQMDYSSDKNTYVIPEI